MKGEGRFKGCSYSVEWQMYSLSPAFGSVCVGMGVGVEWNAPSPSHSPIPTPLLEPEESLAPPDAWSVVAPHNPTP